MSGYQLDELGRRLDDAVTALERIADAAAELVRLAAASTHVDGGVLVRVGGAVVTREDRP